MVVIYPIYQQTLTDSVSQLNLLLVKLSTGAYFGNVKNTHGLFLSIIRHIKVTRHEHVIENISLLERQTRFLKLA